MFQLSPCGMRLLLAAVAAAACVAVHGEWLRSESSRGGEYVAVAQHEVEGTSPTRDCDCGYGGLSPSSAVARPMRMQEFAWIASDAIPGVVRLAASRLIDDWLCCQFRRVADPRARCVRVRWPIYVGSSSLPMADLHTRLQV